MTTRLPFTQRQLRTAIKAAAAEGLFVVGVKPDGTLITANKPIDVASLVPANEEPSPPERSFGDYFNGGQGETKRA